MNTLDIQVSYKINHVHVTNMILYILLERPGLEIDEEVLEGMLVETVKASGIRYLSSLKLTYKDYQGYLKYGRKAAQIARTLHPELFEHESNTETFMEQLEYKLGD